MASDPSVTPDERTWAAGAHAITFLEGGIVAPLVIYFVKRQESEFVAFHALQSLYFGLFAITVIVAVSVFTCGLGLVFLPVYLVGELVATMKANDGEWYQLPVVGPIAYATHHPRPDAG